MVNQTTMLNRAHLIANHAKVEVAPYGSGSFADCGMVDGVRVAPNFPVIPLQSDATGKVGALLREAESHMVSFSLREINLAKLSLMRGGTGITADTTGLDNFTTTAASEVTDHEEEITFSAAPGQRQKVPHPNLPAGVPTLLTIESVTSQTGGGGTAYLVEDDWSIDMDKDGYTWITRAPAGDISATQKVFVLFHYTPPASKTVTTGGRVELNSIRIRLTSTDEDTKVRTIEYYKATIQAGYDFTFPTLGSGNTLAMPMSFLAECDTARTVGDQLCTMTFDE